VFKQRADSDGRGTARAGLRAKLPSYFKTGVALTGVLAATVAIAACGSSGNSGSTIAKGALIPTKECNANKAAGTVTYLTPFGYGGSPGIIEVFAAEKLGYFKDLCLNVDVNGNETNPESLVASNRAQISSTSGAGNLISYIGQGANLVGVQTVAKVNPQSIILNSKYKSLKDLEGKNFGYYQTMTTTYIAMFDRAGVPMSKVTLIKLTNRDPSIITQGQVSGIATFIGSQDVQLKTDGIPFTQITANSLGVKGTMNVMYMNKTFVKEHRQAATDFIRADTKALAYCLKNQAQCVKWLADAATANNEGAIDGVKQNTPVWAAQAATVKAYGTDPLGTFTEALWLPEYNLLKQYGTQANQLSGINQTVTNLPPLSGMMDTAMVDSIYKNGKLVWP
jgi:ABC-type nitrate/sulfonate/bicarbonate transport system substrate-binding protein